MRTLTLTVCPECKVGLEQSINSLGIAFSRIANDHGVLGRFPEMFCRIGAGRFEMSDAFGKLMLGIGHCETKGGASTARVSIQPSPMFCDLMRALADAEAWDLCLVHGWPVLRFGGAQEPATFCEAADAPATKELWKNFAVDCLPISRSPADLRAHDMQWQSGHCRADRADLQTSSSQSLLARVPLHLASWLEKGRSLRLSPVERGSILPLLAASSCAIILSLVGRISNVTEAEAPAKGLGRGFPDNRTQGDQ